MFTLMAVTTLLAFGTIRMLAMINYSSPVISTKVNKIDLDHTDAFRMHPWSTGFVFMFSLVGKEDTIPPEIGEFQILHTTAVRDEEGNRTKTKKYLTPKPCEASDFKTIDLKENVYEGLQCIVSEKEDDTDNIPISGKFYSPTFEYLEINLILCQGKP